MGKVSESIRTLALFLGSAALAFLGGLFVTRGSEESLIPIALVFLGTGAITWVTRRSLSSQDPRERFSGIGAIAMNALSGFLGWTMASGAGDAALLFAGRAIVTTCLMNAGALLLGLLGESASRGVK